MKITTFSEKLSLGAVWTTCLLFTGVLLAMGEPPPSLDPKKLDWYDSWVTRVANDAPASMYIEDPVELKKVLAQEKEEEEARRDRIRREPDAIAYLKALFWRHYLMPYSDAAGGVPSILEALVLREDLTEADVADIAAEVDRILATPGSDTSGGFDRDNYLLIFYAWRITRRFPTPANLERCVRSINRSNSMDWMRAQVELLPLLAEFGSADLLPLMERTQARMAGMGNSGLRGGPSDLMAQDSTKLLAAMKARLALEASGKARPAAEAALAALKTAPPPPVPAAATTPPAKPVASWLLWPAAFLLLLPAWLVLRRRGSGERAAPLREP